MAQLRSAFPVLQKGSLTLARACLTFNVRQKVMTSKEAEIYQGRVIMAAVTGSYATASLLTVVFGSQRFDTVTNLVTFFLQTSLTVWLFYSMWTGRQWARWIMSALFAVGVIFVLVTTINSFNWRLGLFLGYQASLPLFLCLPTSVDSFIEDQKRKRKEPNQSPEPTPMAVTPPAAQEPRQP